ncbi:MAG: flagellar export chaperone FliS [Betaproteobacteria bacterium]
MFSANTGTASNAYRSVGVETIASSASPHQLVLMLFNGARAAVAGASGHMQRGEIAAKGKSISKAIEIIDSGLKASLDLSVGGELAKNLSDLYAYMAGRLFHANLKNDRSALDEVARLLEELGGAWEAIGAKPPAAAAAAPVADVPAAAVSPINRVAAAYGAR